MIIVLTFLIVLTLIACIAIFWILINVYKIKQRIENDLIYESINGLRDLLKKYHPVFEGYILKKFYEQQLKNK